jgi:hypothetical protein
MIKKLFKFSFISGIILFFLGTSGWLITKHLVTLQAAKKAQAIITSSYGDNLITSDDQKVISITRQIFNRFERKNPATVPLLKVRGYVTNRRIPSFIRLESGVIETYIEQGLCDNAARVLEFALKQEGFESIQWNMVTNTGGHSALLVKLSDGREVLADPFYGYVTVNHDGNLISPNKAKDLIKSGASFDKIFLSLGKESDPKFYKNIKAMYMGAEGNALIIESSLPNLQGHPLVLGDIDGKYKDVKAAARKLNIMPYWYYMGHKYNREWVRVLKISQPVKVSMILTDDVKEDILTADPTPLTNGRILEWNLKAGDDITLRDGLAKMSFKRMNSFIPVDQITITPTGVLSD